MGKRLCVILFLLMICLVFAGGDVVVAGKLFHEQTVAPGDDYSGVILLKNGDKKTQEVKIYQTDYLFYADGRSLYGDPGQDSRSNANWVRLSNERVSIPPGSSVAVNFRVDVPQDETMKGSYWSVLMIESIPEESPESSSADPAQLNLGVLHVIRYAYQVITNIGDDGSRMLRFASAKLAREEGQVYLMLDVESTGEHSMRAELSCELYDNLGNFQEKFDGGSHRLHPATSRRYKVDLTNIPKGKYKALIIVDCGDDYVFGKNINLEL